MSLLSVDVSTPALVSAEESAYTRNGLNRELWQGEIITSVTQHIYDTVENEIIVTIHKYAIVMCQDCDLLQDFDKRSNGETGELLSILLYEADQADVSLARIQKSDIRRRITENREERYHFLEAVLPEYDLLSEGIPALAIDFKRFFTVSPGELYRQIESKGAARRSRVVSPFKEHLQIRAAVYAGRIGLSRPHKRVQGPV